MPLHATAHSMNGSCLLTSGMVLAVDDDGPSPRKPARKHLLTDMKER